jgi:hypothetical protein
MKKFELNLLLLFTFLSLFSQNQWNNRGIPIRQGVNIEWARSAAVIEDGSIIYVWSDTRLGDRDIWAQKVSPTGELMWGAQSVDGNWKEGILINGEINRQEDIVIIGTGNNEVIVAWVDFRHEDAGDIYAQKLGADGSLLWNESGVPICLVPGIQISLNIVNNMNGGAYIIWHDSRFSGGTDIYGTHILSNGSIAAGWEINGSPIANANNSQSQHTFWEDGEGGSIVVWNDKRIVDNPNLYAQRLGPNNPSIWQENGILISNAPDDQEKPNIRPDGTGNFIIAWRDRRNENNGDIYAQRIDLNGNLLWANDLAVYTGPGIQQNPRLTYLTGEGCAVVWEDGRNSTEYMDIYAQKIHPNGTIAWIPDGVPVVIAENHQRNPRVDADENGGIWIIWDDGRMSGHPHEDIYVQKINNQGAIQFEQNGKLISNAPRQQYNPLIKNNHNGINYVIWADLRTGSTGMHFKILDEAGNELLPQDKIVYYGLDGDALQFTMLENGGQPIILWVDTRNAGFGNQIYMQTINTNGEIGLQKNGKPITEMTGFNQDSPKAVYVQNANKIVTIWQEIRGDYIQIFAQAIDTSANSLWNNMGIALGEFSAEQKYPNVSHYSPENQDYFYTGWSDQRDGWDFAIIGQKLDSNGNLLWNSQGKVIADLTGDDELMNIVEDYYIWRNNAWPGSRIYVKRVDANGNTATGWNNQGLSVGNIDGAFHQKNASGIKVPEGLFVIWQDQRNFRDDIYAQLISPDGNVLWNQAGLPIISIENDKKYGNFILDEEIYVIWEDFRNGNYNDIFMQKLTTNGNFLWQETGLPIATTSMEKVEPYVAKNGSNYLAFWKEIISEYESDLLAQTISVNGELLWDSQGYIVCNAIKNQSKPQAVSDFSGNTFVIWEDTRSSGKTDIYNIYAQMLRTDGNNTTVNTIPAATITARNFPNPFNPATTIQFEKPFTAPEIATVYIFNIKGQVVQTLHTNTNQAVWDGTNKQNKATATGVYFYQVQAGDYSSEMKKMVLIK